MRNHQTTSSSDPEVGFRALLLGTTVTLDASGAPTGSQHRIQGISDLHAISAAAASQTKGDSDPFLEFLILLYFVTDCEELCDAKCTV